MTTSDRSPRPSTVACLLALLLAVRLLLVVSLAEVFFYGEELEKGTAAKALLDGVDWPYHQLAYHLYEGGGFVISHLTALAFLVVGESILALKLVALLFGALVLWAGVRLTWRHFGRTAALLFGLLIAFGPASFQKLSLLSLGIHFEACLFLLLVLDATLTLVETPRAAPLPLRQVAILGLALGFGFFFNYQLAVAGLWCTLWLVARRPRAFTGRPLAVGLTALVIGLSPLLMMASRVGMAIFDIHGTPLTSLAGSSGQLAAFFRSLYVGRPLVDLVPVLLYPLAFLGALGVLLAGEPGTARRNAWSLASFLALWCAVYLSSGFVVGAIAHPFGLLRFAPVWVVSTVLTAAGLAVWIRSPRRTAACAGGALALLLLFWGARSTVVIAAEGSPGTWRDNLTQLHRTKGYDYAGYFAKVFPRLEDPAEMREALVGFDESQPALLRADFAQAVTEHERRPLDEVIESLPSGPEAGQDFLLGLGAYAARLAERDIPRAMGLAESLPEPSRSAWAEAVGRFGRAYVEYPGRMEAELAALAAGPLREDALRGMGYRAWRRFVVGPFGTVRFQLKPHAVERWLDTLPEADRPALRAGFELGARLHGLDSR